MGSRRNNLIVLSLVVVLLGVAAYFIFINEPVTESTQLGLDLQGGVSAQLEGSQTGGGKVTHQEMVQAADLIRQRIDRLGVAEPDVRVQSENQIVVQIPGVKNPDEVIQIIGSTAQLGFYQVLASDPSYTEAPEVVPADEVEETEKEIRENLKDDDAYEEGKTKILFSENPPRQGDGVDVAGYIVPKNPGLTGESLQQNGANVEFDQMSGKRIVSLQLTSEGGRQMEDLTQTMLADAATSGEPARLAIALDQDIQSAPTVEEPLGQNISISNDSLPEGLPEDEARQLETVLNTGALPVNMKVISQTEVGPTLGLSSLKSGLLASLVGFGLVLLLLLVIYRALGVVADLALLIYAFLLWGLIVIIPITVTLPGIAGIVLSIGVAADANVVIFERIKEEVRRGKTPRSAIQAGYDKGFRAILDGNATTLITAFILFALSSGSVRGFAVLLAIGVVLSMFTAIVITRALLGLLADRGIHLSPALMGVSKSNIGTTQQARAR
jgi:preprotein translocase subunit SecD